jgi:hypothetical protein
VLHSSIPRLVKGKLRRREIEKRKYPDGEPDGVKDADWAAVKEWLAQQWQDFQTSKGTQSPPTSGWDVPLTGEWSSRYLALPALVAAMTAGGTAGLHGARKLTDRMDLAKKREQKERLEREFGDLLKNSAAAYPELHDVVELMRASMTKQAMDPAATPFNLSGSALALLAALTGTVGFAGGHYLAQKHNPLRLSEESIRKAIARQDAALPVTVQLDAVAPRSRRSRERLVLPAPELRRRSDQPVMAGADRGDVDEALSLLKAGAVAPIVPAKPIDVGGAMNPNHPRAAQRQAMRERFYQQGMRAGQESRGVKGHSIYRPQDYTTPLPSPIMEGAAVSPGDKVQYAKQKTKQVVGRGLDLAGRAVHRVARPTIQDIDNRATAQRAGFKSDVAEMTAPVTKSIDNATEAARPFLREGSELMRQGKEFQQWLGGVARDVRGGAKSLVGAISPYVEKLVGGFLNRQPTPAAPVVAQGTPAAAPEAQARPQGPTDSQVAPLVQPQAQATAQQGGAAAPAMKSTTDAFREGVIPQKD